MFDIATYVAYLITAVTFTLFAARRLHRTGRSLLKESEHYCPTLAKDINHLLVAAFCLLMGGFVAMTSGFVQSNQPLWANLMQDGAHFGGLLLFVGLAVFLHVFVLSRFGDSSPRTPTHGNSALQDTAQ